jgi:L-lactate dehydrogenase complex protein LldG
MAAASWVLGKPARLDGVARAGALAARLVGGHRLRLPGYAGGWTSSRTTPLPTEPSFASWWRRTHPDDVATGRGSAPRRLRRPSGDAPTRRPAAGRPGDTAGSGVPGPDVAPRPSPTPDARGDILARIAAALGPDRQPGPIPRDYRRALPGRPADLVAHFASRVGDYRAQVVRIEAGELAATVARLLAAHGSSSVAVPADLPGAWLAEIDHGVTVRRDEPAERAAAGAPVEVPPGGPREGPTGGPLGLAELDATDSVVTAAAAAIAETGTVILDGGVAQGRRALTLVPDHHIVVVREDQIVANVPEVMSRVDPTGPQTWVSGPSATSDIELKRVEGVHGPRSLDVVIVGPPRTLGP